MVAATSTANSTFPRTMGTAAEAPATRQPATLHTTAFTSSAPLPAQRSCELPPAPAAAAATPVTLSTSPPPSSSAPDPSTLSTVTSKSASSLPPSPSVSPATAQCGTDTFHDWPG